MKFPIEEINQFIVNYYNNVFTYQRFGQAFLNHFGIINNEHNLFYETDNEIIKKHYLYSLCY